jgi:hypothetical protein
VLRSRQVVLAVAAAGAAALLIGSTLAVLTLRPAMVDSDGDGIPDSVEAATQRTVVAATAGNNFTIVSRLASAPFPDQFEVSYQAGTFLVTYERARGSDSSYQLELRSLIQWVDGNRNDRIDMGEIAGVGTALGTSAFANAPVTKTQVESADGGHVTQLSIRSTAVNVTLNVTVAERFLRLSSTRVLTPMEVKLDLTVDRANLTPGSSLGLDVRINTTKRIEFNNRSWDDVNQFAKDEAGLNVTGGPPTSPATVFFSWSKSAIADGREIPVTYTNVSTGDPNSYELYLAYPISASGSPVKLVHDPVLGVDSAAYEGVVTRPPELQGDLVLYAASLAAAVFLIALTLFVADRRKRREE